MLWKDLTPDEWFNLLRSLPTKRGSKQWLALLVVGTARPENRVESIRAS
jgi:hypothetical protein